MCPLSRASFHDGAKEKGEKFMTKTRGVSSKTHTKKQLDDYANQNNPNNKAYQARIANDKRTKKNSTKHTMARKAKEQAEFESEHGVLYSLDWMCYSDPYDFD